MPSKARKDSVSVNACIGPELFAQLERACRVTGQSKTVALERALQAYCGDTGTCDDGEASS